MGGARRAQAELRKEINHIKDVVGSLKKTGAMDLRDGICIVLATSVGVELV